MLLVYVDDLFILGPNDESNEILRLLQEHFAMEQTGVLTEGSEVQFLGRTIIRDLDSISFSTSTNYVTALVDLLGITDNRETRITGSSSPSPKSDDTNSLNPADHFSIPTSSGNASVDRTNETGHGVRHLRTSTSTCISNKCRHDCAATSCSILSNNIRSGTQNPTKNKNSSTRRRT